MKQSEEYPGIIELPVHPPRTRKLPVQPDKTALSQSQEVKLLPERAVSRWKFFDTHTPTIVCLCGSTRFMQAFQEANLRETLAGRIVLSVGCDTKSDEMLALEPETKIMLDELHFQKIDLANEILVLNVGGYIGTSTANEIAYAREHKKWIRWLEGCHECGCMQDLIECDMCGDRCCPEHHFTTPRSEFGNLYLDKEGDVLECFDCGCK